MMGSRNRQMLIGSLLGSLALGGPALGEDLDPYKMVRSLQFVQDSIVLGDHSANEMQRFLLKTLDQRLRAAQPDVFRDPRNIDAAFIFAMSGGNPQTLEYLASRDVSGDFDNRLTRVLRRYMQGQGVSTFQTLDALVQEYSRAEIGPYIALVAGNISVGVDAQKALGYFDQVRLLAPGTNLEEAALRRSLAITLQASDAERSLGLATQYVRRFLFSPYASQFADMFVQLIVEGDKKLGRSHWTDVVDLMDDARANELYLRVARRALIAGDGDLARDAAALAQKHAAPTASADKSMGEFYGNLARVSTDKVTDVARDLSKVPDAALSDRDRNLRDAAQNVAQQIMMPAAGLPPSTAPSPAPAGSDNRPRVPAGTAAPQQVAAADRGAGTAPGLAQAGDGRPEVKDAALQSYLEQNRLKLRQIDDLLKEGIE